jgi:hypothetical protein
MHSIMGTKSFWLGLINFGIFFYQEYFKENNNLKLDQYNFPRRKQYIWKLPLLRVTLKFN